MKSETAKKYIRDFEFGGHGGYRIISCENAQRAIELVEKDFEAHMAPMLKFCKKMAGHELGCAPSAGYFEELIKLAREALKHYENEQ